jgi:oxygen-independent coproporphyrinogen-3 oxidase
MDDILRKYAELDVPRYTSYPTAAQFEDFKDESVWQSWLGGLAKNATLSAYIHIPFCEKLCWYCGCHTSVPNGYDRASSYVDTLLQEIEQTAPYINTEHGRVTHLHFGGGTPTYLNAPDIKKIVDKIDETMGLSGNGEVAIEIDPRTFSRPQGEALAEMGFNRASFGVQDFNLDVQKKINRIQPYDLVEKCMLDLRDVGIQAVNFDLIYGLPAQTVESVIETAHQTADLNPSRVAVFGYAHVPWFKKQMKLIKDEDLPGTQERYDQAMAVAETLKAEGYVAVGLDHFVRPEDNMAAAAENGTLRRNFQGYTTDAADAMIGFGVSSISALPNGFAQGGRDTLSWATAVKEGRSPVMRGLSYSDEDLMRADIIERLMCDFTVNPIMVAAKHGFDESTLITAFETLKSLQSDGMVEISGQSIKVPDDRRIFVRNIAQAFDAYYVPSPGKHSRAV